MNSKEAESTFPLRILKYIEEKSKGRIDKTS